MDTQFYVVIFISLLLLCCVVFAPIALLRWWSLARKLRDLKADFAARTQQAAKLAAATSELLVVRDQLTERVQHLEHRFGALASLDDEAARLQREIERLGAELASARATYAEKRTTYDRLISEIAVFDERLAFAEMGIYEPHFDYTDSEAFKQAINQVRELQKAMVSSEKAVFCTKDWQVDGSTAKGKVMTNRNIRLTLRAFNGECDAAISNTRWNNAVAMEKRIAKIHEQIDKLNASNAIFIAEDFVAAKLKELRLTHEYRAKLQSEREERAEAARLAREEQKLVRDMERAEDEENYYAKLLAKAKAEAERATGPQLAAYSQQIQQLEQDLAEAHAKFERAQSMAERTRTGYVYIISNLGSFGPDVVKIGLTRRLDPLDRVRELGDASVPFIFDTHAVIYSEDAPALERALHGAFEDRRINTENYRKEFFRVSLSDVEQALQRIAPTAEFYKDIEAQEFRETLARRRATLEIGTVDSFPAAL